MGLGVGGGTNLKNLKNSQKSQTNNKKLFFLYVFPRKGALTDAGDGDGGTFIFKINTKNNIYFLIYLYYIN